MKGRRGTGLLHHQACSSPATLRECFCGSRFMPGWKGMHAPWCLCSMDTSTTPEREDTYKHMRPSLSLSVYIDMYLNLICMYTNITCITLGHAVNDQMYVPRVRTCVLVREREGERQKVGRGETKKHIHA